MAYKPDISDTRESPSFDVFKLLEEKGAKVSFNDPHASELIFDGKRLISTELSASFLSQFDAVVICTNHSVYNAADIVKHSKIVVDTRNMTKGIHSPNTVRL